MRRSTIIHAAGSIIVGLSCGLVVGCGGSAASVAKPSASQTTSNAQAVAYAHGVNLQPADLPRFEAIGREAQVPAPGPIDRVHDRCLGAETAQRVADISSAEFAYPGRSGPIIKSSVQVYSTAAAAALDSRLSLSRPGQACFVSFLKAVHRNINAEHGGWERIGPFTLATVPRPLPGVAHSFQTTIVERLLTRSRTTRAHVYRNVFGFVLGPAEVNLEVVGYVHRVSPSLQAKYLLLLLGRAKADALA